MSIWPTGCLKIYNYSSFLHSHLFISSSMYVPTSSVSLSFFGHEQVTYNWMSYTMPEPMFKFVLLLWCFEANSFEESSFGHLLFGNCSSEKKQQIEILYSVCQSHAYYGPMPLIFMYVWNSVLSTWTLWVFARLEEHNPNVEMDTKT